MGAVSHSRIMGGGGGGGTAEMSASLATLCFPTAQLQPESRQCVV